MNLRKFILCFCISYFSLITGSALGLEPGKIELKGQEYEGAIVRITGEEAISELYRFEVEVVGVALRGNIENNIESEISFILPGGRFIHGKVQEINVLRQSSQGIHYKFVIGPKIFNAGLNKRFRSFQNIKTSDIFNQIVQESNQRFQSHSSPFTYTTVLQFGESDLNLIQRLFEDEGAYFYFVHSEKETTMVTKGPGSAVPAINGSLNASGRGANLLDFTFRIAKFPTIVKFENFGYTSESMKVEAKVKDENKISEYGVIEYESYNENYLEVEQGSLAANIQLQRFIAEANQVTGSSTLGYLTPGYSVMLTGYPVTEANQSYLITRVKHQYEQGGQYVNEFNALPTDIAYSPPLTAYRPSASYAYGRVVGLDAEEYILGQVRVALSGNLTLWVPMVQSNNNSMWLPKVDDTVLIGFINQDPNRPIVIGSTYDSRNPPPLTFPDSTKIRRLSAAENSLILNPIQNPILDPILVNPDSTIMTNEVIFNDTEEAELLRISAAKDMEIRTENDKIENIANDKRSVVGGNQVTQVQNDMKVNIIGNRELQTRNDQEIVLENKIIKIGLDQSTQVRNLNVQVSGNQNTTINGQSSVKASTLVIEGQNQIVLKVGDQQLVITRNGISLPQQISKPRN